MAAPLLLFAYCRPDHTRRCLESLAENPESSSTHLHVFIDAPRTPDKAASVERVADLVQERPWCREVTLHRQETHQGLSRSVLGGIEWIRRKADRFVVLEDDLILAPTFLDFMNRSLDTFADTPQVLQISGYMHPVISESLPESFFLPVISSWGWGSWSRAWEDFPTAKDAYIHLKNDLQQRRKFNLDNSYDYFDMLTRQQQGKIDSWAIQWYISVFLRSGLVLYPRKTQVHNAGFDGSGTHCPASHSFSITVPASSRPALPAFPAGTSVHPDALAALIQLYRERKRHQGPAWLLNRPRLNALWHQLREALERSAL